MTSAQPADDIAVDTMVTLVGADSDRLPVRAQLSFRCCDPYAVHVGFDTGDEALVVWSFARQLLAEGVHALTGLGDVQVAPTDIGAAGQQLISLQLSSPTGEAHFELDRTVVCDFLADTYRLVPLGAESGQLDLDGELSTVLLRNS